MELYKYSKIESTCENGNNSNGDETVTYNTSSMQPDGNIDYAMKQIEYINKMKDINTQLSNMVANKNNNDNRYKKNNNNMPTNILTEVIKSYSEKNKNADHKCLHIQNARLNIRHNEIIDKIRTLVNKK